MLPFPTPLATTTGFVLTGRLAGAACGRRLPPRSSGTPKSCGACHASADAHDGQFGSNCGSCHSTTGWGGATFNHNSTAFPLTGSHVGAACTKCHVGGVYAGTPKDCAACHRDPAYHAASFGAACAGCHTTQAWRPAQYGLPHTFPIKHHGAEKTCVNCHPSVVTEYTCAKCHDLKKMAESHASHGITDISDCAGCHPNGKT